jgi:two-component system cell cycle response regulator
VADTLRSIDKAARYGGEELFVIMPETPIVEAGQVAERLRAAVEGHTFVVDAEHDDTPILLRLTASVGVAGLPENAESLDGLVATADRALYDAKRQGRNRVVVAASAQRARQRLTT